jgi:galactokinase
MAEDGKVGGGYGGTLRSPASPPAEPAAYAAATRDETTPVRFFSPSSDPAEGLGVLMLFRLIEEAVPAFFRPDRRILIARAPGRLDVLGGLSAAADAPALQLPIAEAACIAVQQRDDDLVRLWSPCRDGSRTQLLSMRLADLGLPDAPIDYEEGRALLGGDPRDRWAAYLLGALLVLAREHALRPLRGVELLLHSDVPERCGVASSAAITVAALRAFALVNGRELTVDELAQACRLVEQEILRGPHRARDAVTVLCAEPGELLALRGNAPAGRIAVPSDLEFVALDSGARGAGEAADAHAGAAAVDVDRFLTLLAQPPAAGPRRALGDLLFDAHDAYALAGRTERATDFLVALARQRREAGGGVLGAKATGRGGGGAVLLLGEHGKVWYEALRLKKALLAETGHSGHIFRWSSPGAMSFGAIELTPTGA